METSTTSEYTPQSKQGRNKSKNREDPWVPPGGDYEVVTEHPLQDKITEILGIEDSLVQPVSKHPSHERWLQGIPQQVRQLLLPSSPKERTLDELKRADGSIWRPVRMGLKKRWPAKETDPEWFRHIYTHLYQRVSQFSASHFEYGDIPVPETILTPDGAAVPKTDLWLGGFSNHFLRYVSTVARQDNSVGGWDLLLASKLRRRYLVTAIIGLVLEKNVWDSLLFGADEVQKEMLTKQDLLTVKLNGYRRTANRSDTVRSLLGVNKTTPLFWYHVDRLTLQTINLLLPLIRLLDANFPKSQATSLRTIYQELHNIVTEAAFLSLGIRWSRDIYVFSRPHPGQPWSLEQENVNATIYEQSKLYSTRLEELTVDRLTREANLLIAKNTTLSTHSLPVRLFLSTPYNAAITFFKSFLPGTIIHLALAGQDEATLAARRDRLRRRTKYHAARHAKAHITVWPGLHRYQAVGELGGHPVIGHMDEGVKGQRITRIMPAQVLYYYGLEDASGDASEQIPTLEEWVRGRRRGRVWKGVYAGRWVVLGGLLAWLMGVFLAAYVPFVGGFVGWVSYVVGGTVGAVVGEVWGFSLEVVDKAVGLVAVLWRAVVMFGYAVGDLFARLPGWESLKGALGWRSSGDGGQVWTGIGPAPAPEEQRPIWEWWGSPITNMLHRTPRGE